MEDLIKKAKSGDKLAFTELMLQMQDELYKIAKIRLKNDDDVFDVIQDTMLSAYKSLKKLKHNATIIDNNSRVNWLCKWCLFL